MTTYHIVGDVHGNAALLRELLLKLGYDRPDPTGDPDLWVPPEGAKLVTAGDLVDRGYDSLGCLGIFMRMSAEGHAMTVLGNHDFKCIGLLRHQLGLGPAQRLAPGRLMTWTELLGSKDEEKRVILEYLEGVPPFLELDDGKLIVVHARWDRRFRHLDRDALVKACAFGRTDWDPRTHDKERVPDGNASVPYLVLDPSEPLKQRARWTRDYKGRELVVWGHQIVRREAVVRIGNTVNVESGCFQGHALSAYVYPDDRVVQVRGTTPWRTKMRPYLSICDTVFPESLEHVASTVRNEGLDTVIDYLTWIELVIVEAGAPSLPPQLEATHRRIFDRIR